MILKEIISRLEAKFPPEAAMEWDNVGLLLGDANREIKKVLLALDITYDVVEQAVESGADLILSHHPIMFLPVKRITPDTELGKILLCAAENKICIYSAHTNCDVAKNGINARLAEIFELKNPQPLEESGLGRIGDLEKEMDFSNFARLVCAKLDTPNVRFGGDKNRIIKRVAVGSGACADSIPQALAMGADVMITADVKYHEMLDAVALGINVIDAGHYPTEIIVTDIFAELLRDCGLTLQKAKSTDVFKYVKEN